jgi:methionine sulfoxide reductase heme-binding subunit
MYYESSRTSAASGESSGCVRSGDEHPFEAMMSRRRAAARVLNAPLFFWAVLVLPAVYFAYAYLRGSMFYGELLHATGELGAQFLIAALALTPLRLLLPGAGWVAWLARRRRYLGVAAFGYSLLHAAVYLNRQRDLAAIIGDAAEIAMWTGWLALAVMLALAATSNDASVRWLRNRWKWLHRAAYAAAVLTFMHWILSAFDPVSGILHAAVLASLEAIRLWRVYAGRRRLV